MSESGREPNGCFISGIALTVVPCPGVSTVSLYQAVGLAVGLCQEVSLTGASCQRVGLPEDQNILEDAAGLSLQDHLPYGQPPHYFCYSPEVSTVFRRH